MHLYKKTSFGYIKDATIFKEYIMYGFINPSKTKRGLLYLKTQYVLRSKHFLSRL